MGPPVFLQGQVSQQNSVPPIQKEYQQNSTKQQNSVYQPKTVQNGKGGFFQTTSLLDAYLDSARYLSNRSPMKAVDFINKAIEESINTNNREKEAQAFLILGDIQQHLGQHDLAVENYKKSIGALDIQKKKKINYSSVANQVTLFNAYKQMAVSLTELSGYDKALETINFSLSKYAYAVPVKDQMEAQRILADVYLKQGKTQSAREVLTGVLEKEQASKNTTGEIQTLLAIGKTWQKDGNENTALEYYTKAKDLSEKTKQSALTIQANGSMASVYRAQKNVDKEVQARNDNIALNNSTNNQIANTKENVEIGNAYLNVNQVNQAANYYNISTQQQSVNTANMTSTGAIQVFSFQPQKKELFSVSNDLGESADAYKTLGEKYAKQNQFEEAALYFGKYAQLQDSIKKIRDKELDDAIAISTNIGKNQQRIDLLEKERELNGKSIDILKQDKVLKDEQLGLKNGIIISLSVIMALMLLAVFFIIRSSREKKKIHQLLALKSLRGQMNPHFIFNALNSVNHYVSQNDERQANRYLSDFSRLMRLVMDSSKYDFIALNEELEMLRLYLQLEHARFKDKFEYEIRVSEQVEDAEWELPPMLVQPYLENAVWHGLRYIDGKGTLKLELEQVGAELQVTITDSGIGRNRSLELKTQNQKKQTSLGMQNISNRVQIMNEIFHTNIRVEIGEAFPGQADCGTRVKLTIPKKPNTNA
jgi:tetratricopeptide (TPR) repeat protein